MKLGIIGTGNVGSAIALAAVTRGSAREIVLVNRTRRTAEAVATDIRYGAPLSPPVDIKDGDYDALAGAGVVLITSGVNERPAAPPIAAIRKGGLGYSTRTPQSIATLFPTSFAPLRTRCSSRLRILPIRSPTLLAKRPGTIAY